MIEHLVLFKFKPEAPADHVDVVAAGLQALAGKIPGVVQITAGRNFADRAKGFQLGLVVRLEDRAALDAYAVHPDHRDVVERLVKPQLADLIAVDYEY